MNHKVMLLIDDVSYQNAKELPQKMPMSKLFRWVLKAFLSDMKTHRALLKSDKEYAEVQEWVRPRVMAIFGLDDTKAEKIIKAGEKIGL